MLRTHFRCLFAAKGSHSNTALGERSTTTLVLRSLPPSWKRRRPEEVVAFANRVVAAQPALVNSSMSMQHRNNDVEKDRDGVAAAGESAAGEQNQTIPAGAIPQHIRERWGLPPIGGGRNRRHDDDAPSEEERFDDFPGLAKYFSKDSKGAQQSRHKKKAPDNDRNKNDRDDDGNGDYDYDVDVKSVRFTGETGRALKAIVEFATPSDASRFSRALQPYLAEVRRSRGLAIPASLVGSTPDTHGLSEAPSGTRGATVTAATLDNAAADVGLHAVACVDWHHDQKQQDHRRREKNSMMRSSSSSKTAERSAWRKKLACDALRRLGEGASSSSGGHYNDHQPDRRHDHHSQQQEEEEDVRVSVADLASPRNLAGVASARAEELSQLRASNNPLLAGSLSSPNKTASDFSDSSRSVSKHSSSSSSSSSSNTPDFVNPQLTALLFRKKRGAKWDELAEEDELDTISSLDIDRYLMSPDVLWDTHKKYIPRRRYFGADVEEVPKLTTRHGGGRKNSNLWLGHDDVF